MSTRYYVKQPLSPGPVELVGAEAHHLATVSRIPTGSQVCLFNGDGHEYPATVEEISRRRVVLRVLRVETPATSWVSGSRSLRPCPSTTGFGS